jgi:hypothetical protein
MTIGLFRLACMAARIGASQLVTMTSSGSLASSGAGAGSSFLDPQIALLGVTEFAEPRHEAVGQILAGRVRPQSSPAEKPSPAPALASRAAKLPRRAPR